MRKVILILLIFLVLCGCTTRTEYVAAPEIPTLIDKKNSIYHPPIPAPVGSFPCAENFNCWKVIEINGVPYKAISHNDSIDFAVWMKENNSFNRKIKETLCFYRKDLQEDFCSEYSARSPVSTSNGTDTKSNPGL